MFMPFISQELTMRQILRRTPLAVLPVLLVLSMASPVAAKYFGRNKVQYKEFKFEVLKTDHFDIYFYEEERENAARVGRMAERWYARLSSVFEHEMSTRQPLVLYASHPDFEQTNVVGGMIGEGTGGVTEGLKRRVVLPLAGTLAETDHVLGHELVHAFQYDISARRTAQGGASGGGIESLPLWFVEGLAEYLSIGPVDAHTAMWLRDATRQEEMPEIEDLDSGQFFPYRWGQAVWAYVGGKYGDDLIGQIYRTAVRSGNPIVAFEQAVLVDDKELSTNWHADIRAQYGPVMSATARARTFGRSLTASDKAKMATNVSPSISPDGKHIVFFSSRDLFSIDLFLAETATGRIVRKLVDTALSTHFTSLQFIGSAGSWSPDSKQFAIAGVHAGKAVLAILDIADGDVVREIEVPQVGEILNPTWSPDGKSIAFSATVGGDSDLFIYDLAGTGSEQAAALKRITSDLYADLQPAWSPDGDSIAFVTDRFTTNANLLNAGDYRIALLDVASGRISPVSTFARGKNINPQWNPDSRRLYFVSDQNGISNVYIVNLQSGALAQVTNIDSGISGITALSPAISSAIDARTLAVSAYEDDSHNIYIIESPEQLAGTPITSTVARVQAATLPPVERESMIARILNDPSTGLPAAEGEVEAYKSGLSLDTVGQPYISAGVDRFGGMVGGGIAFNFSDMLGNHNLYAQVSADTYGGGAGDLAKNTGAVLAYTNLSKRWNWGFAVEQSPYIAGGYALDQSVVNGEPVLLDQTIIERQVNRGVSGMVAYPFSPTARVEFGGGFTRTSFDRQVRTTTISQRSGRVLDDRSETTPLADSLNMSSVNAAFITDSSLFGATSPVAGHRSRFEVAPTFGDLRMTTALADYRHYFMPARFYTIAVRGMHYGRYGRGGEDERLIPLFIGYPEFVRGYGINSFASGECASSDSCPTFDRLVGSRMLVGNIEFRFPLLRPFGVSQNMYGPLPVEVAFFLDGEIGRAHV